MPTYNLKPEQIIKLNKMKRLNLNPTYGGELEMPDDPREGGSPVVRANGVEVKITMAEAFKLGG